MIENMTPGSKFTRISVVACLCFGFGAGCVLVKRMTHRDWTFFVRERIPVTVQRNKPITFEIHMSQWGNHDVGIRCSPEVWSALTYNIDKTSVQLIRSNKSNTSIVRVDPGGRLLPDGIIPDGHYLFHISGEPHARAVVEIAFPDGPSEPAAAEVILMESLEDVDLP